MSADPPDETFLKLVQHCCDHWHQGKIPKDRAAFIEAILQDYMPESSKRLDIYTDAEWQREHDRAKAEITKTVDYLAQQQNRWTN
jgi:hypothetical protein